MTLYRKKPVVIEAMQFWENSLDGWPVGVYKDNTSSTGYRIDTLEGTHEVTEGDFIITGVKGERYPCKPDIFDMTYERLPDAFNYRLLIIQSPDPLMWYAKKVGQTVPYVGHWPEGFKSREDAGYINIVKFGDAKIVKMTP